MTAGKTNSFDLVERPWIAVRFLDGTVGEVSLREVFARADEIHDVAGELPTQDFAIIRLLLAILHRALDPVERPVEEWGELWRGELLLGELTGDYLEQYRDRFDLLHPETPFYQVAPLRTPKGEVSSLGKLIADVPNGEPYFTTRQKRGVDQIGYAEAARWLVHCQAFDPSGIKSGAVGDPRVKGGKGYPIGTAWVGSLGGLLLEGENLRETLLLNLVLGDTQGAAWPLGDFAVWERGQPTEVERNSNAPAGIADLFTWQSRRVRLDHDGSQVTGVTIANGDPLKPQTVQGIENIEPMTGWRRSQTQEKALGTSRIVYMPRTHDPSRSLWRGLGAILPQADRETQRREGSSSLPPLSLGWIARLAGQGAFAETRMLRTRAIGIEYGIHSAIVAEIVDDSLAIHPILLTGLNLVLAQGVIDAVGQTESAVSALAQLAGSLALAQGGDPDGPRDRAREGAYFLIDAPFRSWLASLSDDTDTVEAQDRWFAIAKGILLDQGRQLVHDAGPAAWVGRIPHGGSRRVNSAEAFGWFVRDLALALSTQEPESGSTEPDSAPLVRK